MLFSILYEIVLIFIALLAFPKFLYDLIVHKKYRKSLLKRLGSGFPLIKKDGRPLVWIHAVSLGETKAVAALAKTLKAELKNPRIIFSTTTETGYVEGCRMISADHHVYLPFDFGWIINPIVKRSAPNLVILCESDFWYNFLSSAKRSGAHIALVNGKISTRSLERFQRLPTFCKKLFNCIDQFCVQSNTYKRRFESLGVPPKKVIATGNMKFDGDYAKLPAAQIDAWRQELGISHQDPVLVIGSSHHPEELLLLKEIHKVWQRCPELKVVLVPRHPERFNEVAGLLQKNNINFRRLSHKNTHETSSVILIDAMGLLRKCYQLADIAVVAGSYTAKVGGHNILEPSWYGVPVLFGPHMYGQPDLLDLVVEYKAGLQVPLEEISDTLIALLQDTSRRKTLGDAGLKLANDVHGATNKTWRIIKKQVASEKKIALKKS
jgi:3-deoxy-D-manno-octulosonic-acid transferase